ncbi:MAG TPA: G/U mismatch-specific DNA glycosylase [Acidimicrobiales bacterium]|nr:G/U mismatch-specific DNA glycosylase [Acidimicrobiales bacterium]
MPRPASGRSAPPRRPNAAELAAAEGKTVPDIIGPDLGVLFCGINPGRWSGAVGHHFAHPGNRFWKALEASGFTDERLTPDREQELLRSGVGITNVVARTTAAAAELSRDELRAGRTVLEAKVAQWRPRAVAFLGMTAYRTAFGRPHAGIGEQPERLGTARLWVLPNPSGLQGRYGMDRIASELAALRLAVGR